MKAMFIDVEILVKFFIFVHEFIDFFFSFPFPYLVVLEFSSKIVLVLILF